MANNTMDGMSSDDDVPLSALKKCRSRMKVDEDEEESEDDFIEDEEEDDDAAEDEDESDADDENDDDEEYDSDEDIPLSRLAEKKEPRKVAASPQKVRVFYLNKISLVQ